MGNTAMALLDQLVLQLSREQKLWEPEWKMIHQEREARYKALRERCGEHRELLHAINDLVDACFAEAECQQEFCLRLGLQLGIELGKVDVLPPAK